MYTNLLNQKDLEKEIRVELLINAKSFNGSPNPKSILGKLLPRFPELKSQTKDIMNIAIKITKTEFPKSIEEIESLLEKLDPLALNRDKSRKEESKIKSKERKENLVELNNVKTGDFRARYAPDPSKFPHLGHAIHYKINSMYATKYQGEVNLRFDDTNPTKVKLEYYDAIKEGLNWAKSAWKEEVRASLFLDDMYEVARSLLKTQKFYVCSCSKDKMKEQRDLGIRCTCPEEMVQSQLNQFEDMVKGKYPENSLVIRMFGKMDSENQVMRDPVMFRIIHASHPALEKSYFLWPLYDFESSYMDHKLKTTHVIRSGEFGTMRQELQSQIINLLGGPIPEFFSYGRYNIIGSPTKGREIRELVENKVVDGWDDIRLVTIAGLKRRGISPDILEPLIREKGTTPKQTNILWSDIVNFNRTILSPKSRHFFAVRKPTKIHIIEFQSKKLILDYNQENDKLGKRTILATPNLFIDVEDDKLLKLGNTFRLKDLANVTVSKITKSVIQVKISDDQSINTRMPKIQWVPEKNFKGEILVPEPLIDKNGNLQEDSLKQIEIYFEDNISSLKDDEIVQLERIGFAKLSFREDRVYGHIIHN